MDEQVGYACVYCGRGACGTYQERPVCAQCIRDYQLLIREDTRKPVPGALEPPVDGHDAALAEIPGRRQARLLLGAKPDEPLLLRLRKLQTNRAILTRTRSVGLLRGAFFEMEETVRLLLAEIADADNRA